jgi:hypothetical protein
MTQAEWDANRKAVKAQAAETVAAQAREARERLAALRRGQGYPAAVVNEITTEASTEEIEEIEDEGYEGHTVEELKGFLAERGLPVSGNKAELVARLSEDDEQDATDDESEDE